ncbi:MAG: DUF3313 family protein [Planctomycetota bacterium]|jgi:hypothetical protein
MRSRKPLTALFCLWTAASVGCKATAAEPAGFVDASRLKKDETLPFHGAWRNPDADLTDYDKIWIAPVDTSHLLKMDLWKEGEAGASGQFEDDVRKIAVKVREYLSEAFREPPEGVESRFTVVDEPKGAKTIKLEFAIVEIVPSKAILEAASWAMPYGTGLLLSPFNTSTAAMEGRFTGANSGQVILAFADREGEKLRPVDLGGFTWYTHARGIMMDWARQLIQVANQKPGEKIEDTKVYTIKPW